MKLKVTGCCLAAMLSLTGFAVAQGLGPLPPREITAQKLNVSAMKPNLRASQVIGMAIHNPQGDNVGSVTDVVIHAESGKVRYVAVTYGGFLGIGDKLFAVPYDAFKFKVDPNSTDKHVLVLDVTQKQMEGAQGFDQNHWPDFADRRFTDELDQRYRVKRDANGVKIESPDRKIEIDVKEK